MSEKIVSLQLQLKSANGNQQKIDLLNELCWELKYLEPNEALSYGKEAISLSEKISYPQGKHYGILYSSLCKFLLSVDENFLEKIIESQKFFEESDDKKGQAIALNFIGNLYDNYGEYENGLQYCFKSLKIAKSIDYKEGWATVLSTMGMLYSRLADYKHSIESFNKSLKLREEMQDFRAVASSLNLIARTFSMQGDFQSAIENYKKCLLLREEIQDAGGLPWTYIGLASVYEKLNDFDSSQSNYQKALHLNEPLNDKRCELHCLLGLGKIFIRTKNPFEGKKSLEKALTIAESVKAKPLIAEIHQALAQGYETEKSSAEALQHFKIYHLLKEELLNAETANRLKHQQISFAVEKSEKETEIFRLKNVELKAAYNEIEEKNKNITDSINYAKRIQQAILPSEEYLDKIFSPPLKSVPNPSQIIGGNTNVQAGSNVQGKLPPSGGGGAYFIFYKPKDIVSGDFYYLTPSPSPAGEGSLILAAADCTGHGVPGAFMSMIGTDKLNHIVLEKKITNPAEILSALDSGIRHALKQDNIKSESRDGMEMALCCLTPYPSPQGEGERSVQLQYSGAMRSLIIIRKNGLEEIKADKISLGGSYKNERSVFTNHIISLEKGDVIYMYSDGFGDQFGGEKIKKFSTKKLKELLLSVSQKPMNEQKKILEETFENWKGENEQMDDVLVIGVRGLFS